MLLRAAREGPPGWATFVTEEGQPDWSKVVLAGESQGSGMALLAAKAHKVLRVAQFGGVDDCLYNLSAGTIKDVAQWITLPSATPTERIWGLGNVHGTACAELRQHCRMPPYKRRRTATRAERAPLTRESGARPPTGPPH